MEKIKNSKLKNALVALCAGIFAFLGVFTAQAFNVSADEVTPSVPRYGDVLSDGTLYVSDTYSEIFKQPDLAPEFKNHKTWEVGEEVQKGDELGGWYRVEMVYDTTSLFNFNNVIPNSSQAIQTLRLFIDHLQTNVITIPGTWYYQGAPSFKYYYDFYLPEEKLDITACTSYKIDETTGQYVANEYTLFTYLWGTEDGMPTITYDYDLASVYKLTPVADPNYVAPEEPDIEEPGDVEEPGVEPEEPGTEEPGDEPTVEPEEPGDEPAVDTEEETFGDKIDEWLKQQGANWQELGEAAKGLSIGAVVTLISAVIILVRRRKR